MTLTPPKPFSGLAAGSVSPCCATQSACPTSALTSGGKDLRSFSDEPTHLTGFSFSLSIILLYVYLYTCQDQRPTLPHRYRFAMCFWTPDSHFLFLELSDKKSGEL